MIKAFPVPLTRRSTFLAAASALLAASCDAPNSGSHAPSAAAPAVGQGLSDPIARRFYAIRGGQAAWAQPQVAALKQAVLGARAHGLDPAAFAPKTPASQTPAALDESLTVAALSYAKALSEGFVDPHQIEPIYTLRRSKVDLAQGLNQALAQNRLGDWLGSLPPADREYQQLSAAYVAAIGQAGLPTALPNGAPVGSSMAPSDRARQLAANLERRRWLARQPPAHRIDANTAGAFLVYFRPDQTPGTRRTVVGRDDHPTPSIEASFQQLIANPPWRVPKDIAAKEILPKGPGYMAREDMHVIAGGLVEQAPGPKSSLGLVKFDVQDPYDIYLHDTPSKALFAETERHRSHGCVRVQGAVDFARAIAAETGRADAFDAALASGDTKAVELGQTIPVRMLYHTAWLDDGGTLLLAPDVYGTDDKLAAALGFGQMKAAARKEPQILFGP